MREDNSHEHVTAVGRITAPKASDVLEDASRARIRSGEWP